MARYVRDLDILDVWWWILHPGDTPEKRTTDWCTKHGVLWSICACHAADLGNPPVRIAYGEAVRRMAEVLAGSAEYEVYGDE